MSTIQTARYEQFTRRLLRLVGGSIMPRLQNDLSPVINIEDPADPALLFWKGHKLAAGTVSTGTPGAAEFATASVFNPLGSGKIVWVYSINFLIGGNRNMALSLSQTRTAVVVTTLRFTDSRAAVASVPICELGIDVPTAVPARFWTVQTASGEVRNPEPVTVILHPGFGLFVTNTVVQQSMGVNFAWLERSAETPELES